jgi:hypothetical protein
MPYGTGGVFTRLYDWTTDATNEVPIRADRMDDEFDGIATALSTAITKDGRTTVTENIPFGGKRANRLGNFIPVATAGTASALTVTSGENLTDANVYDGAQVMVRAHVANAASATVTVDTMTARPILRVDGSAIAQGDMALNGTYILIYRASNTSWYALNARAPGVGQAVPGPAITTATTLVVGDANLRRVAMTTDGQSITLPDATGLPSGSTYIFTNTNARPFGVRANGGVLLAACGRTGAVELTLSDNSTAAGVWAVSGENLEGGLVVGDSAFASTITQGAGIASVARISNTGSLTFARNASGHLFVSGTDHSVFPNVTGSAVAVDTAGSCDFMACLPISSTRAIAFWAQGSNRRCGIIDLTGSTATVYASASTATSIFPASINDGALNNKIVALSSSLFLCIDYPNSTAPVRATAVSVSGTVCTIGTSVTFGTGTFAAVSSGVFRASDTSAFCLYIDDSGTAGSPYAVRGVVLSISGTTITVNTSAGINDVTDAVMAPVQLSDTSYISVYQTGSGVSAVVFSVSGTTTTVGSATAVIASVSSPGLPVASARYFRNQRVFATSATSLFATFGSSDNRHYISMTVSGTTITVGSAVFGGAQATLNMALSRPQGALIADTQAGGGIFAVSSSGSVTALTDAFAPAWAYSNLSNARGFWPEGVTNADVAFFRCASSLGAFFAVRLTAAGRPAMLGPVQIPFATDTVAGATGVADNLCSILLTSLTRTSVSQAAQRLVTVEAVQ